MQPPSSSHTDPPDPLDVDSLRILVGPTASGKSDLAMSIAEANDAEIVSLDSMQVYQGLDIGTAKPSPEEQARVPHHMLDLIPANEVYDVQQFMAGVRDVLQKLQARKRKVLFVGGTGFYLAALLRGLFEGPPVDRDLRAGLEARAKVEGHGVLFRELVEVDPASAERLHQNDQRRVIRALEVFQQTGRKLSDWQTEWNDMPGEREKRARIVGLTFPVAAQDMRIRKRARQMMDCGWKEEAVALRTHPGLGPGAGQALGYGSMLAWADGQITPEEALDEVVLRTRQFARRQRTWYRKFAVQWVDGLSEDRDSLALDHFRWQSPER